MLNIGLLDPKRSGIIMSGAEETRVHVSRRVLPDVAAAAACPPYRHLVSVVRTRGPLEESPGRGAACFLVDELFPVGESLSLGDEQGVPGRREQNGLG